MRNLPIDDPTDSDFTRARQRALRRTVLSVLRRQRSTLLPFEEVRAHLAPFVRGQYDRGIQQVPLANIIGSQGRYSDFDRSFLPRGTRTEERWTSVNRARYRNIELPPVELYKLGDIYFVADGNHRVSVARHCGQVDIRSHVVELQTDVSLTPALELRDLIGKEEQGDFFEWTNLSRLRPGCTIEVTELGGYLDLIRHINQHRQRLSAARGGELSGEEAIVDWYDTVYQPAVAAIRRRRLLRSFDQRTETDLYIWIMEHRQELMAQTGRDLSIDEAVSMFAGRFTTIQARLVRRWPSRGRGVAAPRRDSTMKRSATPRLFAYPRRLVDRLRQWLHRREYD